MKKIISIALCLALIVMCVPTFAVFAEEVQSVKPVDENGKLYYDLTKATFTGEANVAWQDWYDGKPGATNNDFICLHGGSAEINIDVPYAGYYKIAATMQPYGTDDPYCSIFAGGYEHYLKTYSDDCGVWPERDMVDFDAWVGGVATFKATGGVWFEKGVNTVSVNTNGGWILLDRLVIRFDWIEPYEGSPAKNVIDAIKNLPESVTKENYAEVLAVADAYKALTSFEKTLISGEDYNALQAKSGEANAFVVIEHSVIGNDGFSYQVEDGTRNGDAFVESNIPGYTGTGAVNIGFGSIKMEIDVPYSGTYNMYIAASSNNNENNRYDKVVINSETPEAELCVSSAAADFGLWKLSPVGPDGDNDGVVTEAATLNLNKGKNTVEINCGWGYCCYDRVVLVPLNLEYETDDVSGNLVAIINGLSDTVTAAEKDTVQNAMKDYAFFTPTQQVAVTNYDVLRNAFEALKSVYAIDASVNKNVLMYEIEDGLYTEKAFVGDDAAASGGKFVNISAGKIIMNINVPKTAKYEIAVIGSSNSDSASKCDTVFLNNSQLGLTSYLAADYGTWTVSKPGAENWEGDVLKPIAPEGGVQLTQGTNTIEIRANWGYANYDALVLTEVLMPGDVDGDGFVNGQDVVAVAKTIIGKDIYPAADINGDGKYDILDLIKLKKMLAVSQNI